MLLRINLYRWRIASILTRFPLRSNRVSSGHLRSDRAIDATAAGSKQHPLSLILVSDIDESKMLLSKGRADSEYTEPVR